MSTGQEVGEVNNIHHTALKTCARGAVLAYEAAVENGGTRELLSVLFDSAVDLMQEARFSAVDLFRSAYLDETA